MSEWISVNDRVPADRGTVLAVTLDYEQLGPLTVPARYDPDSDQWSDVDNIDCCGDEQYLFKVTDWRPMPLPPQFDDQDIASYAAESYEAKP